MKYLGDVLTGLRLLLSPLLLVSIWQNAWVLATILFLAGILSDAFDGIAARRWPYTPSENNRLWWRKDPHLLDNMADLALSGAAMIGLALSLLNVWQAIVVVMLVGLVSATIDRVVKTVGKTDAARAERIDVAHGWLYGTELAAMLGLMTWLAFDHWKVVLAGIAVCSLPLLWLKWDRITARAELTYNGR